MARKEGDLELLEKLSTGSKRNSNSLPFGTRIARNILLAGQKAILFFPEGFSFLFLISDLREKVNFSDELVSDLSLHSVMELVMENPFEFLQLAFIYVVLFLIRVVIFFLIRIYEILKFRAEGKFEAFANSTADFFEDLLRSCWWYLFRRPAKQYYDFVAAEHRHFDSPGATSLAVPCLLQAVYVNLTVSINDSFDVEINGSQKDSSKETIGSSKEIDIWRFLSLGRHDDRFRHLLLVGEPGSGKSTLLKRMAVAYSQGEYKNVSSHSKKAPRLIPILLTVREISDKISSGREDIRQLIVDTLHGLEIAKSEQFAKWIEGCLKDGRCLVMIDGLDEAGDRRSQASINAWAGRLIKKYSRSYFLITSRPFGHQTTLLRGVTTLELHEFSLPDVESFVFKWFLNRELTSHDVNELRSRRQSYWQNPFGFLRRTDGHMAAAKKTAGRLSGTLTSRIRSNPALSGIAVNPLSLSMMVIVHSTGRPLPESRASLYGEICQSLLSPKGNSSSLLQSSLPQEINLTVAQKTAILQTLSWELMKRNQVEFSLKDISNLTYKRIRDLTGTETISSEIFFEYVKQRSGLLVDTSIGRVQFSHRCIQEYLAALQVQEVKAENFLLRRVNENWWNETIRIYASTSAVSSAIKIVNTAVDAFKENPERNVLAFKLAYDCLDDCPTLPKSLEAKLYKLLNRSLESENNEIRRYSAIVKLLQRFSRNFVGFNRLLEFDKECLTRSEYQLFIDSEAKFHKYYQPDSWYSFKFRKSTALKCVFVLRHSDVEMLCNWLSEKYSRSGFKFRLPTPSEEELICREGFVKAEEYGCWCQSEKGYSIVGIDPKRVETARRRLRKEVLYDLNKSKMLISRFEFISNVSRVVKQAITERKKDKISVALNRAYGISTNLEDFRGVFLDSAPFYYLITTFNHMVDAFNFFKSFKRDGDIQASERMKEELNMPKKYLKSHKGSRTISETLKIQSLIEKVISNHGHAEYREQEEEDIYRIFHLLSELLIKYSDRIHFELSIQMQFIEMVLQEINFYDGSYDIDTIIQVFNDISLALKADSVERKIISISGTKDRESFFFIHNQVIIQPYIDAILTFLDRSSSRSKEIDLLCLLPFFSLSFCFWSSVEDVLRGMLHERKLSNIVNVPDFLIGIEGRKLHVMKAYLVAYHVSLCLQRKLPCLGGIRLVREKVISKRHLPV